MKPITLSLALVCCSSVALAQGAAQNGSTGVAAARALWETNANFIMKAAEQLAEADYSFKPVSTVRSFGEILGHVAGAELMSCAAALGEAPRSEDSVEKAATTKAALIAALKDAADYCGRAYSMTDSDAAGAAKLFGQERSKMYALVQNASHVAEHYGNLVTYLRIKGIVPPSSQRSGM